jgi:hypothetical protein
MWTDTGVSDIVAVLKRFKFQVRELPPEETVSGNPGFEAVYATRITIRFDGDLYIDGEPLLTPMGEFDINSHESVMWLTTHFQEIVNDRLAPHGGHIEEMHDGDNS